MEGYWVWALLSFQLHHHAYLWFYISYPLRLNELSIISFVSYSSLTAAASQDSSDNPLACSNVKPCAFHVRQPLFWYRVCTTHYSRWIWVTHYPFFLCNFVYFLIDRNRTKVLTLKPQKSNEHGTEPFSATKLHLPVHVQASTNLHNFSSLSVPLNTTSPKRTGFMEMAGDPDLVQTKRHVWDFSPVPTAPQLNFHYTKHYLQGTEKQIIKRRQIFIRYTAIQHYYRALFRSLANRASSWRACDRFFYQSLKNLLVCNRTLITRYILFPVPGKSIIIFLSDPRFGPRWRFSW